MAWTKSKFWSIGIKFINLISQFVPKPFHQENQTTGGKHDRGGLRLPIHSRNESMKRQELKSIKHLDRPTSIHSHTVENTQQGNTSTLEKEYATCHSNISIMWWHPVDYDPISLIYGAKENQATACPQRNGTI